MPAQRDWGSSDWKSSSWKNNSWDDDKSKSWKDDNWKSNKGSSWGSGGGRADDDWKDWKQSKRPRGGKATAELKAANEAAAAEGRALYVRAIPQDWDTKMLHSIFEAYGTIESANLMPIKENQTGRAAFINFTEPEACQTAAEVCDNQPVESKDGSQLHNLVCSIRQGPGQKTERVSGFSDMSKARQERRVVYMAQLPMEFEESNIRSTVAPHGVVESVKMLPSVRNKACFVVLSSQTEAVEVIEQLDGATLCGRRVSVTYPHPPKRTRDQNAPPDAIEVRGFSKDTLPTEVSYFIEACGWPVESVKMLRHDSLENEAIAIVHMKKTDDVQAVMEHLNENQEFIAGKPLEARIQPEEGTRPPPMPLQDLKGAGKGKKGWIPPPPPLTPLPAFGNNNNRAAAAITAEIAGDEPPKKRRKGEIVVGRLVEDGPWGNGRAPSAASIAAAKTTAVQIASAAASFAAAAKRSERVGAGAGGWPKHQEEEWVESGISMAYDRDNERGSKRSWGQEERHQGDKWSSWSQGDEAKEEEGDDPAAALMDDPLDDDLNDLLDDLEGDDVAKPSSSTDARKVFQGAYGDRHSSTSSSSSSSYYNKSGSAGGNGDSYGKSSYSSSSSKAYSSYPSYSSSNARNGGGKKPSAYPTEGSENNQDSWDDNHKDYNNNYNNNNYNNKGYANARRGKPPSVPPASMAKRPTPSTGSGSWRGGTSWR
eukprot:CAMPEP_0206550576 /NCGR_PEP_ID=MMETSP0325_2-20121206/15059_1 /ASSEMBLY_ACC=CAM_ASM_000347 /TAXON_ID=2866 /ORGANISM="Crypthecodinium cohnii, Strain Seligo" /LENGTH=708 /DNA_ID=CAMNT_0054050269 /DNA_START=111 /DNA_END=2240 /DNA_ORIENTATION=+